MPTRKDIVDKAREYVNTPFRHQGRIKGLALDCVGLILCVAEDLGILDTEGTSITRGDCKEYGTQPAGGIVFAGCVKRMRKKPLADIKPGDVVALRNPIDPCHVAIVCERDGILYMIHATSGGKSMCVENILDSIWYGSIAGVFEFAGVVD